MINIQHLSKKSYFHKSIYSIAKTIVNSKENSKKLLSIIVILLWILIYGVNRYVYILRVH